MRYPTAKKFAILTSTVHRSSSLALLVARILADHAHHPLAADDLAVAADSLHRCQHFHTELLNIQLSAISHQPNPARQRRANIQLTADS
jgi:hypothetical protein